MAKSTKLAQRLLINQDTMDIYIGEKKVVEIIDSKERTYLGKNRVEVHFEDETTMLMPKEVYDEIKSEKSTDATTLQYNRLKSITQKIMVLITEDELSREDMNALIGSRLPETLSEAKRLADARLWGKPDYAITLLDIDNIINDDKDRDN